MMLNLYWGAVPHLCAVWAQKDSWCCDFKLPLKMTFKNSYSVGVKYSSWKN